ncbi:c-type cytochrome [Breoghania sp. L-A4]|uniref:c-type cytochrome n=1 Tax=Breoghania sp. L-A4 TaxID=2304600 RepID=UPI0020BDCB8E|nr:c-type cytochrome [Breoghania sp. L-A4]
MFRTLGAFKVAGAAYCSVLLSGFVPEAAVARGAELISQMRPPAVFDAAAPSGTPDVWAVSDNAGDPEYGAYLASECVTCHQASGADDGIPSITNWPPDEFTRALHAYKNKTRDNPVMQLIASSLSDEQIAALAAYFAAAD